MKKLGSRNKSIFHDFLTNFYAFLTSFWEPKIVKNDNEKNNKKLKKSVTNHFALTGTSWKSYVKTMYLSRDLISSALSIECSMVAPISDREGKRGRRATPACPERSKTDPRSI